MARGRSTLPATRSVLKGGDLQPASMTDARHSALSFLEQAQTHLPAGLLTSELIEAFLEVPRDLFLSDFRLTRESGVLRAVEDHEAWLKLVYSYTNLGQVSATGELLPSTATSPLTVLQMIGLLQVRPGDTVVEVGSGCGYVVGLLGHLVGPRGRVIGLEILPELARRSRAALAALGSKNTEILSLDAGAPSSLPRLDRILFSTGVWSLPPWVFEQTQPDARVITPLQTQGSGEDIAVLVREPEGFRAEHLFSGSFIDSAGSLGRRQPTAVTRQDLLARGAELGETHRIVMPFGMSGPGLVGALFSLRTAAFQSYLAKSQPRFFLIHDRSGAEDPPRLALEQNVCGLGLARGAGRSLAVLMGGALVGYGDESAFHALLQAYREWTELMMPGVEAFDLFITSVGGEPPGAYTWREERVSMFNHWRLSEGWPRLDRLLP